MRVILANQKRPFISLLGSSSFTLFFLFNYCRTVTESTDAAKSDDKGGPSEGDAGTS